MFQILFVDDDENLLKINRIYFEQHGYGVTAASTSGQALSLVKEHRYDCALLDIILPSMPDGYQICEEIRNYTDMPILFLTSLTEQEFLYRGFSAGGDDYITKPYDLRELELRVAARISQYRRHNAGGEILYFPPLSINVTKRIVTVDGRPLSLTGNEFDILVLLARSPEQAFSPEEIYRAVWNMPDLDSAHTVQVHVARMRRKLDTASPGHRFIGTSWGRGYLFSPA